MQLRVERRTGAPGVLAFSSAIINNADSAMGRRRRFVSFITGGTLLARGGRLVTLVTTAAAIDQVLLQIWPTTTIHLFRIVRDDPFETILTGLVIFLTSELLIFQEVHAEADQQSQKSESAVFATAVVQFARHLQATRRHGPLLLLRDNLSHVLHLLRAHTERIELGRLALAAAVEAKSDIHRALILMDDLGWAFAENKDPAQAKRNIGKAISIIKQARVSDPIDRARLGLAQAKGLRHLAMLSAGQTEAMEYLKQAADELATLKADEGAARSIGDDLARDEAQLKHAEACVLSKELLDGSSARPIADQALLQAANSAMSSAEEAAAIFDRIGDEERHAKALLLVEQIQKRLGQEVDAIETNARIRRVLRAAQD